LRQDLFLVERQDDQAFCSRLAKNAAQVFSLIGLTNLYLVRKKIMT
jgi:hypothetical protein